MSDLLSTATRALQAAAPDGVFVGGCVRDWLLGRPIKDLDVALPAARGVAQERAAGNKEDPSLTTETASPIAEVGRSVARRLGGSFFWLREGMGVARIVVKGPEPLQIDIVPLEGTLEADLRRRDFTINAMAVRVMDGLVAAAPIIDPTGGREDLAERRLRPAAPDAFERDPLRCLRAFRFRTTLGCRLAPETEAAVRAAAPGLVRISGERIRDELFVLLDSPHWLEAFADLLAHNLVAPWSPALAAATGLEVGRSLETWLAGRALALASAADLQATLESPVTPPRNRRSLVRLAALALRAGPEVRSIARTLALSGDETRILTRAIEGAAALSDAWPLPGRGYLRFWQRWEPGAVEAVLLALSEGVRRPTRESEALEILLGDLLERRLRPQAPLLSGEEVMSLMKIPRGPEVGRLLQQIEEQRADTVLKTPEDARRWLSTRSRP